MEIKKVSLKNYTSLRIGGLAHMAVVTTEEELVEVVVYAQAEGLRIHILGSGTNTFFGENLENLLVIKNELKGVESKSLTIDYHLLTIGAGEIWDDIVLYSVNHNLWGIENLSLIPGTVGAAPVQNIGAYGVELANVFHALRAYDTVEKKFVELSHNDCHFGYRDSPFKQEQGRYIITSVTLKLSVAPRPIFIYKPLDTLSEKKDLTLEDVRDLVVKTRTTKLPDWKKYPNAGSFFKNVIISSTQAKDLCVAYKDVPLHEVKDGYKVPTAWLIEHVAGMKGVRKGDVGTWPTQPLVLVNYGDASTQDVFAFSQKIIDLIHEKTGIMLEREVNMVM